MRVECGARFKGLLSLAGEVKTLMPPWLLLGTASGHGLPDGGLVRARKRRAPRVSRGLVPQHLSTGLGDGNEQMLPA